MLDDESTPTPDVTPEAAQGEPPTETAQSPDPAEPNESPEPVEPAEADEKPAKKAAAKKTAAKKTAKKTAAKKTAAKKTAKRTTKKAATKEAAAPEEEAPAAEAGASPAESSEAGTSEAGTSEAPPLTAGGLLFQAPEPTKAPPRKRTRKAAPPEPEAAEPEAPAADEADETADTGQQDTDEGGEGGQRRRRRRGGRRRRKNGDDGQDEAAETESGGDGKRAVAGTKPGDDKRADAKDAKSAEGASTRRRRRRRRQGEDDQGAPDDPENTVVRVRERRQADDEISGVSGSTRLEAKKQRRREGREAGRRRAPIVSEAEFLARREAVDREMVVRQRDDVTQIGVLEDDVLVEHYVARDSQTSLIGNVYLGRVQNVLPSMEAAFIDIGKGRNAVLYAGEVNWGVLGKEGQPRRIETALKSGQTLLVQVTKDPVGHKGARLTSQISLPGRYLVYLPGGQTSGISRKLPDTERNRLKNLLKEVLPEDAGVIVRTAAEGASEDELRRDVTRLTARWDDIEKKVAAGQAPQLLYGEPDLMIKVVRDLFTEDFTKLVVSGDDAWDMIEGYVSHVAPDLMDRVQRWQDDSDVFASYRLDEQIAKALERKVWLPSGGSLIIDRTEAMTVVDVNTGKFTGSGGNLEETVTKNNLEAAEEVVRQLRLRDIGGIIVVDFIDMVLESNRDLVLRRLIECLGRDRTRHQVAEVTSLGLVQMTRKRIGTGLLEAFSEPCESCGGRGLHTHMEPVEPRKAKDADDSRRAGRRSRRGGDRKKPDDKRDEKAPAAATKPTAAPPAEARPAESPPAEPEPAVGATEAQPDTTPARAQPAEVPAEAPAGPAPAKAQPAEVPAEARTPGAPATEAAGATTAASDGAAPAATQRKPTRSRRPRRRAASRPAGPPEQSPAETH